MTNQTGEGAGEMVLVFRPDGTFEFELLPTRTTVKIYDEPPDELVEVFARIEKLAALKRVTVTGTYETKDEEELELQEQEPVTVEFTRQVRVPTAAIQTTWGRLKTTLSSRRKP